MAGLYDIWQNRETGEKVYTYCIITVPSAKKTEFVHERMPAILGLRGVFFFFAFA